MEGTTVKFIDGMFTACLAVLLVLAMMGIAGSMTCAGIKDRLVISGHADVVPVVGSFWVCL